MADNSPALPPPPGRQPNFLHPDSLARWNVVCVSACLSITTLLFLLRSGVRLIIKRSWILEDYLVLISWAGLLTYCALMTTVMNNHGGVHGWDLTKADVHQALYWFNATSIVYGIVIYFTKIAILLLYRRVFLPHRGGGFDWVLRTFIAILTGFYIATSFVKIWECSPRERIWNSSIPGRCIDIPTLLNTSGLFNSITDLMILLVPIKFVWKLQTSTRQKVGIAAVFTVGFCAPVFSTIGFVVRLRISSSPDVTYHNPEILLWATAEISTGLICVCVPELAVLFQRRRRHSRRPSESIVNGASASRRTGRNKPRRLGSLDQEEPWDSVPLRQKPYADDSNEVPLPPPAVITKIQGGLVTPSGDHHHMDPSSRMNDGQQAAGIYTSVKMERSVAQLE